MSNATIAQEVKDTIQTGQKGQTPIPVVIAVPKERVPGEKRVATVPDVVQKFTKSGHEVRIEHDAGTGAFYPDNLFIAAGAKIASGPAELLHGARIVLRVQPPTVADVDQLAELLGCMAARSWSGV